MKVKKKNKKIDVINQKKIILDEYISEFSSVMSSITNMITGLSTINEKIDIQINEINEYEAELRHTKEGLISAREQNKQVCNNLNALFAGSTNN